VVETASASAIAPRRSTPQAFLCRRCAARLALAPYRRCRLARAYWRDEFPRWAVATLWPGFSPDGVALTVARFIAEAGRRGDHHEHVP
jgi:hypothetical protein